MLDPLTSFGLVVNIVSLVDFGLKAVSKARELATDGFTEQHQHFAKLARETHEICSVLCKKPTLVNASDLSGPTDEDDGNIIKLPGETQDDFAIRRLANDTQIISHDLSLMLQGLKIDDPTPNCIAGTRKRKRDVAKSIIKGIWHDNDLKELRQRLLDLQQAMMLRLAVMQSQTSSNILHELRNLSWSTEQERTQRLALLNARRSAIVGQVGPTAASSTHQDMSAALSQGLDAIASQAHHINLGLHILNTLHFDEIESRQEGIVNAHQDTFRWVFDRPELGFTNWLSTLDGLFWITGKPGSGKSTLMKLVARHTRTDQLLKEWAGHRKLAVAYHYFWNAGTAMQKNQLGLLRTLLYHIVLNSSEIALNVVPRRFHQGPSGAALPWTLTELRETLQRCGKEISLDACFCFFIDGLDECRDDHTDLIELISCLSRSPNIKICVSSRPWNVFTCAYEDRTDGQLAVQDLTQDDITRLIADRLSENKQFRALRSAQPRGCSKLMKNIREKSQGVFLWVVLVVRSLLRGLGNDDDLRTLQLRLDEYPETLDGYYQRMFERIEKIYRHHAARIMLVSLHSEKPLPLCAPKFLAEEVGDSDYALKLSILRSRDPGLKGPDNRFRSNVVEDTLDEGILDPDDADESSGEYQRNMETSQRYLDARCADLLEISGDGIHFLHRTARDFLSRPQMRRILTEHAGESFDVILSQARLTLARIKTTTGDGDLLGTLISDLLRYEDLIAGSEREAFREILDNFNLHGDDIVHAQQGSITLSDPLVDGNTGTLISVSDTYSDSMLAFSVRAALIRLRSSPERVKDHRYVYNVSRFDDDEDKERAANSLFGLPLSRLNWCSTEFT